MDAEEKQNNNQTSRAKSDGVISRNYTGLLGQIADTDPDTTKNDEDLAKIAQMRIDARIKQETRKRDAFLDF
ncbi:MAG: hypothetical protein WC520_04160 [Candidatus Paceibacterota bacterium]